MNTPRQIAIILLSFFLFLNTQAQINVTATAGTVGPSAYTTLQLAFVAINNGTHQGTITIGIAGNTTEISSAILNASGTGVASYTNVNIAPTGGAARVISGNILGDLINLNGADNVKFDGLNTVGNSLEIRNNTVGGTALKFINDATNDTINRCTIKGVNPDLNSGIIVFSTASVTGNDANILTNNILTVVDGTSNTTNIIYSKGSIGFENSEDTIFGNSIYNFYKDQPYASCGIQLAIGNIKWAISGNSFFQTVNRNSLYNVDFCAIFINGVSGGAYSISGNFIGGMAANCGASGSPLSWSQTGTGYVSIYGIILLNSSGAESRIQSNIIKNIYLNTYGGGFTGIYHAGSADANISANIIGISNNTGASNGGITLSQNNNSGSSFTGISNSSNGTNYITSNTVAGISILNPTPSAVPCSFYGILNGGSKIFVSNNIIGSSSTANNITNTTAALGNISSNLKIIGIYQVGGSVLAKVDFNIIANLTYSNNNVQVNAQVAGIYDANSGSSSILSNTIFNLNNNAYNYAPYENSMLAGIVEMSSGLNLSVASNTIYGLYNSNTLVPLDGPSVVGFVCNNPTSKGQFTQNKIYDINCATKGAKLLGIWKNAGADWEISNNMITITNGANNNGLLLVGIWDSDINGKANYWYNTVYTSGSQSSSSFNGYAFFKSNYSTTALKNNIFDNKRIGTGTNTGNFYAIATVATYPSIGWAAASSDYNYFYTTNPSTLGLWGVNAANLAEWKNASSGDCNSVTNEPIVYTNTAIGDLHINMGTVATTIESGGVLVVRGNDFDGEAIPGGGGVSNGGGTAPDIGADAFNGVPKFTCLTTPPGNTLATASSVCVGGTVTLSLQNINLCATGYSFQWYSSVDNITYVPVAAATGAIYYNAAPIVPTYYKCNVTCANGPVSAFSIPVLITINALISTTPAQRCGTGTLTLAATATSGTIINWFSASSAGSLLGTGTTFTTPIISTTTSYFVETKGLTAGSVTSGTFSSVTPNNATPSAFPTYEYQNWYQMVFSAAELTSFGLRAGNIKSLTFNITTLPTAGNPTKYNISMGSIGTSTVTNFVTSGLTNVYACLDQRSVVGANKIDLTTTYYWDGISNILIDMKSTGAGRGGSTPLGLNASTYYTNVTNTCNFAYSTTNNPSFYTSSPTSNVNGVRLLIIFEGQRDCINSTRVPVVATINPLPILTLNKTTDIICVGGSSAINVTSTLANFDNYTWSGGPLTQTGTPSGSSVTLMPIISPSTYILSASNSITSCLASASVVVSQNITLPITITPSVSTICAGSIQSLNAFATGSFVDGFETFPSTNFLANGTGITASSNTSFFSEGSKSVLINYIDNLNTAGTNNAYVQQISQNLSAYTSAKLTFSHICILESGYDYGYVQYSTNGGTTWTSFPTSSYVGTGNLYNGVVSFTTSSYASWSFSNLLWKNETINIPASALTANFKVRFMITADGSVIGTGWLLDDIKITAVSGVTWSPVTDLYTDAAATIPYTGSLANTIYSKPIISRTYTATNTNVCGTTTASATVNITAQPNATISYIGTPFCQIGNAAVTTGGTIGTTGGTYSSSVGLMINASSGLINLATSTAGTYTVTYSLVASGGCLVYNSTTSVVINPVPLPIAITPSVSTICAGSIQSLNAFATGSFVDGFETFPSTNFLANGTGITASSNTSFFSEGSKSVLINYIDNLNTAGTNNAYVQQSSQNLSAYTSAKLTFSHICILESGYDYGYVQYSTNGGTTWTSFPTSSYVGSGNLYNGVVSFTTSSYASWSFSNLLWKNETINIPASALTANFKVRFMITADGSVIGTGWLLDDIKITAVSGVTWSPVIDLYTDAAATIPYTGSLANTIYSKPIISRTYTATNTNVCGTTTPTANVNVKLQYTWGGVDNNWFNAANWCPGVPTALNNVIIPAGLSFYPIITSGIAMCKNLDVQTGAQVSINGLGQFDLYGIPTSTNGIDCTNGSFKLAFAGVYIAGSNFTSKTIKNLIIGENTSLTSTLNDTLRVTSTLSFSNVNSKTFTTNDNLTLVSNVNSTANFNDITNGGINTGNTIMGKVNIERYLFAKKAWRLLATPVIIATSPTVTDAWREGGSLTSTLYGTQITGPAGTSAGMDVYSQRASMKSYDGATDAFVDVTNTSSKIANDNGYFVFVRGDRSVTQFGLGETNLRIKGDVRMGNQTFNVIANKYRCIGNPYPSRINFATITKTNIVNAFTVWNPNSAGVYNLGAYETYIYDLSTGDYKKIGGAVRNFIESGEAIFVQSNSGGAGSVVVKETDKRSGSINVSRIGVTIPTLEINLFAKDIDNSIYLADGVFLNFDNSFGLAIDNNDVRKISNTADNLAIKNSNTNLIAERRPALQITDTIKLSLTGTRVAPYRFDIDPSLLDNTELEALLIDKFLQTATVISFANVTSYTFDITTNAASKAADRFMIVFKQAANINFTTIAAARNIDKTIKINFGTANEKNVSNYTVEQSNDGTNFKALLGIIEPTSNNGDNTAYTKIDAAASKGANWYRVKITNSNGSIKYSAIAMVAAVVEIVQDANPMITIYPNPIQDGNINLHFSNQPKGIYSIKVITYAGQTVALEQVQITSNKEKKNIQINALAAGKYQVIISNANGEKTTLSVVAK